MDVKELGFALAHIGINQADAAEAKRTVDTLCALFGFESRETDGSYFVGRDEFEVMKMPFLGRLGHVAIYTSDAVKAKEYLETKGVFCDESTASYGPDGRLMAIYFKEEIAGFAFHLKQR